jgi:outer membrane lipoprotein-sorting protein
MNKKLVLICIGIFFLSLTTSQALAPGAQEANKSDTKALQILGQMIEAMGGRQAMENVKDTTATGTIDIIPAGMQGSATLYTKTPNMFRMDIEIMGMAITSAFDGEVGWAVNPQTGAVEELTGQQLEDLKRQALGDSVYLHPEKHGIVFTSQGQEKIDDKDYNVLKMTYADGFEVTMYLDPATHLVYKTISMAPNPMTGVEGEMESYTADYRKVDGIMAAFLITQYVEGEEFMVITLDDVQFNSGLEDSLFKK